MFLFNAIRALFGREGVPTQRFKDAVEAIVAKAPDIAQLKAWKPEDPHAAHGTTCDICEGEISPTLERMSHVLADGKSVRMHSRCGLKWLSARGVYVSLQRRFRKHEGEDVAILDAEVAHQCALGNEQLGLQAKGDTSRY